MAKKKYKIRNWSEYNKALVQRGNLFLYLENGKLDNWYTAKMQVKKRGRPKEYTQVAIDFFLMVRVLFSLPLRQSEGVVNMLMKLGGFKLSSPNYSLISKRMANSRRKPLVIPQGEDIHVLVDSTGLKIYGEGEWKMRIHGKSKRRTWRKFHIGIDAKSQSIVACEITEANVHDGTMLPMLLEPISEKIGTVTGDGAYDSKTNYEVVKSWNAVPVFSPPENATANKQSDPLRRLYIERIKELGNNEQARKKWKQEVGYHKRSLVETAIFRFKTIFGDKLSSRQFKNQQTEALFKAHLLNKMTLLGMPNSYAA